MTLQVFDVFVGLDLLGVSNTNIYIYVYINGIIYVYCITLPKTNMATQTDGLETVTPFKNNNFGYLC